MGWCMATDIENTKLPTIPMTESDIKRCMILKKIQDIKKDYGKKNLMYF